MYPDLAGVATSDLVEKKGGGNFSADYINWARTMNLLHKHAEGWQPAMVPNPDGEYVHRSPDGTGYILIQFVHPEHGSTQAWPQAVMDNRNNAMKLEQIDARDITDTHRRGICAAAAGLFGLAYELWAKMELENPMRDSASEKHATDDRKQTAFSNKLKSLGMEEITDFDSGSNNWMKIVDDPLSWKSVVVQLEDCLFGQFFPKWISKCKETSEITAIRSAVDNAEQHGFLPVKGDALRAKCDTALEQLESLEGAHA